MTSDSFSPPEESRFYDLQSKEMKIAESYKCIKYT